MENPINYICSIYTSKYPFPPNLKISISIVDDLLESINEFFDKTNRSKITNISDDSNGYTCMPKSIEEAMQIFIAKERVVNFADNNFQFICTIFHELTHAIDFYNYCNDFCEGNYDNINNTNNYFGFKMWSEFNAKRISYLLYFETINGENYDEKQALENFLNYELGYQNNYITEQMNKSLSGEQFIYDVVLYLGRYYCWEKLFPSAFEKGNLFPKELKDRFNDELSDLYECFKQHLNYSKNKDDYSHIFDKLNTLTLKYFFD